MYSISRTGNIHGREIHHLVREQMILQFPDKPDGPMARRPDGPMARRPDGPMARSLGIDMRHLVRISSMASCDRDFPGHPFPDKYKRRFHVFGFIDWPFPGQYNRQPC